MGRNSVRVWAHLPSGLAVCELAEPRGRVLLKSARVGRLNLLVVCLFAAGAWSFWARCFLLLQK